MQSQFSQQSFGTSMSPRGLSRDMTDVDLSSHLPVTSRGAGGLNIQFFYQRVEVKSRNPRVAAKFETRLCVAKQPKGDRFTVATRFITDEDAMREFPQEYAQFKRYQEVPTQGTPLHELPGISQSQIAVLIINGLRSVEDLVEVDADLVSSVGMEAVHAKRLAQNWIAKRDGDLKMIELSALEANMESEKASLIARLDAAERNNANLQQQVTVFMERMNGNQPVMMPHSSMTNGATSIDLNPELPGYESTSGGFGGDGPGVANGIDDLIGDINVNPLEDL